MFSEYYERTKPTSTTTTTVATTTPASTTTTEAQAQRENTRRTHVPLADRRVDELEGREGQGSKGQQHDIELPPFDSNMWWRPPGYDTGTHTHTVQPYYPVARTNYPECSKTKKCTLTQDFKREGRVCQGWTQYEAFTLRIGEVDG